MAFTLPDLPYAYDALEVGLERLARAVIRVERAAPRGADVTCGR